jgi:hypothetical protein
VLERHGLDFETVYRHERGHCNGYRHDEAGKTITTTPQEKALMEYGDRRAIELQSE